MTVKASDSITLAKVNSITDAQAAAIEKTKAYFFYDDEGVHVTANEGDATTGNNVLIDTEGIKIRNGTTVLASFKDDTITLGDGSVIGTINLCGGSGRIVQVGSYGDDYSALHIQASYDLYLDTWQSGGNIPGESAAKSISVNDLLTKDYRPAIVETQTMTGLGYNFVYLTLKDGYELVSAKTVRSDASYAVTGIQYNAPNNIYTILLSQSVTKGNSFQLRLTWVKV